MKSKLCLALYAGLLHCLAAPAPAGVSLHNDVLSYVTGTVSNEWTVDIDTDLVSMAVLVELTVGTVYDPFTLSQTFDGGGFGFPGDTYVTANGNGSTGIVGGVACFPVNPPLGAGCYGITDTLIDIHWASPGADTNDIGMGLPIGRFSFTDDAMGTWKLTAGNDSERAFLEGVVVNGAMVPEPGTLTLLSLGGLAWLRRR